jgi:hypothetical protein
LLTKASILGHVGFVHHNRVSRKDRDISQNSDPSGTRSNGKQYLTFWQRARLILVLAGNRNDDSTRSENHGMGRLCDGHQRHSHKHRMGKQMERQSMSSMHRRGKEK